jgi:putative flippase GtrA
VSQLLRFGSVGALGFAIDAGALLVLVAMGIPPLPSRGVSFVLAATFTFTLNHHFTFRAKGRPTFRNWLFYLGLTTLGALINLGVFYGWITKVGTTPLLLLAGTAIGSIAAMFVNFTLSRTLIFNRITAEDRSIASEA